VVLNAASEEEQYFHKQRRRRAPGQLTGALDERDGVALALPCGDHPVRRVLIALQDQLPDLIPVDLEHYGLSGGADARLAKDHPAQGLVASCAEALGVERYEVTEALGGALRGAVEPGTPPLILLPHGVSRLPAPAQLFLYGRLLTRLVAGTQALDPGRSEKLAPRDLELLLAAIQRTADPGFGEAVAPAAILDDLTRRIQSIVPAEQLAQARAAAAEAFQGQQDDVLLRWIRSTELGACRGGLLCSGSLVSAVTFLRNTTEGLLPDDIVGDLISFTSSSLCTDLRRKVGLSLME